MVGQIIFLTMGELPKIQICYDINGIKNYILIRLNYQNNYKFK